MLTQLQFSRIRNQLAARCGLYLDESRAQQLGRAVLERMALTGCSSVGDYELLCQGEQGSDELHLLAELLVNHETQFFRNQPHFRALRQVILPEFHRTSAAGRPLRIWSAGCATGEEPYSIAITAVEELGMPPARPVRIWATDISRPAIARARTGLYRGRSLSNVTPDQLATFFQPEQGAYRVRPEVQSLVEFQELNLLDPFPAWTSGLDMIFCQNVTIYFQLATSRALIGRFYDSLAVGGYLFLGFSETLWGIFDRFETIEVAGAFAYRKPAEPSRLRPVAPQPERRPVSTTPRTSSQPVEAPRQRPARAQRSSAPPSTLRQHGNVQADQISGIMERAWQLRAEGQQHAALEELRRVSPDAGNMPALLALIAWLHADLGEWEQAAAEARRALELDVLQEEAHMLLGVLDMNSGAWSSAASHLERVLYLDPGQPVASFRLAECYRQLNRKEQAVREYRNTLAKLEGRTPTELVDGVAVSWLRESCQRWLNELAPYSTPRRS